MTPMRVVFIQRSVGPGGSKNSLLQTLRIACTQKDFQFRVLCGEEGSFVSECRELGIEPAISRIPEWRKWPERFFFARKLGVIAKRLSDFAPDYVISNERWWAPHAQFLARQLGCRSASYVRESALTAAPKARQYHLHKLDRVLCVSAALKQELDRTATLPGNSRVVYNPVQRPTIDPDADAQISVMLNQFPRVKKWLLHIGLLSECKNQIGTIRTLRALHDAGLQDWGLILAGDTDTDYFQRVEQEISRVGLEQHVCVAGQVAHLGNLIQRTEGTLLSSRHEGLPRAVIESFLLGKMCFATSLPGLAEIYGKCENSFVSATNDPESLAQTVLEAQKNLPKMSVIADELRKELDIKFSPENHWCQLTAALAK